MLATIRPSIIGVSSKPELVTLAPSTPWSSSGTKMIIPNIPRAAKKPTTIETAKARFLKSANGTIGSLTRCSMMKNATSMAKPKPSRPRTWNEVHPWSFATESATSTGISPAASAADPMKSMSRQDALVRTNGRKAATTRTPRRPTGRFT